MLTVSEQEICLKVEENEIRVHNMLIANQKHKATYLWCDSLLTVVKL